MKSIYLGGGHLYVFVRSPFLLKCNQYWYPERFLQGIIRINMTATHYGFRRTWTQVKSQEHKVNHGLVRKVSSRPGARKGWREKSENTQTQPGVNPVPSVIFLRSLFKPRFMSRKKASCGAAVLVSFMRKLPRRGGGQGSKRKGALSKHGRNNLIGVGPQ